MAVFAPMPNDSAAIAVSANPGLRHSIRSACFTSVIRLSMNFMAYPRIP